MWGCATHRFPQIEEQEMASFYHVDRGSRLSEGQTIQLVRYANITPLELQRHVDDMFPEGVSRHGNFYFLNSQSHPSLASPNIEVVFEYVRRALCPSRPSRFQSFFAFPTKDAALRFRKNYCSSIGKVWEVTASHSFTADMALLRPGSSILFYSYFAHLYWQGQPGSRNPEWEVLLIPPVTILRQVA
jgi:hypothetical protein